MWEIVARKVPYAEESFGPNGRFLRKKIQAGLRPSLEDIAPHVNDAYVELMQQCWHSHPSMRPMFPEICTRLTNMRPEASTGRHSFLSRGDSRRSLYPELPRMRGDGQSSTPLSDTPFELLASES
jgi:hypothetical protein